MSDMRERQIAYRNGMGHHANPRRSSVLTLLISVAFSQEHNPISDADIEALLLSGVAHERLVDLVRERGVSFAPSQAVRTRLRAADRARSSIARRAGRGSR